jgi:hypothetical protein
MDAFEGSGYLKIYFNIEVAEVAVAAAEEEAARSQFHLALRTRPTLVICLSVQRNKTSRKSSRALA